MLASALTTLAAIGQNELKNGLGSVGYGLAAIGPGIGIGYLVGQSRPGDGAPARDGRATSVRRCSSASRSPRPSRSSGSSSSSSELAPSRAEETERRSCDEDPQAPRRRAARRSGWSWSRSPSRPSPRTRARRSARSSSSASRRRSRTTRLASTRATTRPSTNARRQLPQGEEPLHARRLSEIIWGGARVPRSSRSCSMKFGFPAIKKTHQGTARTASATTSSRRRTRRRRPRPSSRSTRPSSPTPAPRRTRSSRTARAGRRAGPSAT